MMTTLYAKAVGQWAMVLRQGRLQTFSEQGPIYTKSDPAAKFAETSYDSESFVTNKC